MSEKTTGLRESFKAALSSVDSMEALEAIRVEYLGKKGLVTELLKDMKNLSVEEKKTFGQEVNVLKEEVTGMISEKRERIKQAEIERENNLMPEFDISAPANLDRGSYHPITLVQRQCEEIFKSM
ncbi:MAG: phenylalanine--tRNA ligase subunit alpha, partial [Oscillospiraceae bacterium]|nr:phenylalanine--tRNA ligase subunit alpha [Oscillospiraceae bacterium]